MGGVATPLHVEITVHQGKQVARLGEGILPLHKVATTFQFAAIDLVSVGEQVGVFGLVGADAGAVAGQDVGPVQVIGYAAKALCLTLGAVGIAGLVEPFQRRVGGGIQISDYGQHTFGRQVEQGQTALPLLELGEGDTVHADAVQDQSFPIQHQGLVVLAAAAQPGDGGHPGQGLLQLKIEIDAVDPVEGRPVILAILGRHGLGVIGHYCVLPRVVINVSEAVTTVPQGQIVCIQPKERAT